jgi:hypothetical protein
MNSAHKPFLGVGCGAGFGSSDVLIRRSSSSISSSFGKFSPITLFVSGFVYKTCEASKTLVI